MSESTKKPGPSGSENGDHLIRIPEGYRLIPVENDREEDDDEIDLVELVKTLWDGRMLILKTVGIFILVGLFVALFSPEEYESEAILMPEVQQQQGGASQLLRQFGGSFGINAGSGASGGMISPEIYPRIVNNLSFQRELLNHPVNFSGYGVTTTVPDFYENHYSPTLTQRVNEYTFGLPGKMIEGIMGIFRNNVEDLESDAIIQDAYISLTRPEFYMIQNLRSRISVNLDSRDTGLLTTKVKLQDPRAAAELNAKLIELLQQHVTDYRIEKVRQTLAFVEEQHNESRTRFESAQLALAEFRDRNVTLSSARAQTELERLQDEKDLAFNIYNSISQRLEETKLQVQEQTPVFNVVQAVNIPVNRSEPRRPLIMVIFVLLGGMLAIGIVFVRFMIKNKFL
ncbi:MAG: Wzz/FepE/Etk N-terminal domain-containing protein [Balneolales bacterium]